MDWMLMPLRRYAEFDGRSCRQEYWMFMLLQILVGIVMIVIVGAAGAMTTPNVDGGEPSTAGDLIFGLLALVWFGLFVIPTIAVTVRRFHDQDKSGWFWFIRFVPIVGGLILIIFMCTAGTQGSNQYGEDPLGVQNLGEVFR
jgi:uncharacterized membrane protein YhaH (DUF805 family)